MKIALLGKRKLGFMNGTCTKESCTTELQEQWETCNAIVISWLMNKVSTELLCVIAYASNAHLVWEDLREIFDKDLWIEYDAMVPKANSKDYVDHLKQQRLLQFLSGLNDSYDQARKQNFIKSNVPSINQAYAMVIENESRQCPSMGKKRFNQLNIGQLGRGNSGTNGQFGRATPQFNVVNNVSSNAGTQCSFSCDLQDVFDGKGPFFIEEQYKQILALLNKEPTLKTTWKVKAIWQDLYSGRVKGIGKETEGLYIIKGSSNNNSRNCNETASVAIREDCRLWHQRLGHPLASAMKIVPKGDKFVARAKASVLMGYSEIQKESPISHNPHVDHMNSGICDARMPSAEVTNNSQSLDQGPDVDQGLVEHTTDNAEEDNELQDNSSSEGFIQSNHDHSLFILRKPEGMVIILVYVDDLLITGSNDQLITEAKEILHQQFKLKNLGELEYFLGIEILRSASGVILNQRKCVLELIYEMGLSGAKLAITPLETNVKLTTIVYDQATCYTCDSLLEDASAYQRLIGCLLRSIKHYVIKFGESLISWKSNKLQTVSRSSAEVEYRSMASTVVEVTWLLSLFQELGVPIKLPVLVQCDSKSAIQLAVNPIFHEQNKHIEIDSHFIRIRSKQGWSSLSMSIPRISQLIYSPRDSLKLHMFIFLASLVC
ncbi:uncharacterized protein LOC142175966 [Nicotiana tabacum]|uniref:Uncharacterized protein LOC142175966 n=1 Tax=Nicotiana tabacum TaxID=4097 RepID=A0AC58TPC7_TOBAC